VAVAYVGGALRRYLEGHGELPDETLVAACPASIRDSNEQGGGGNRLFGRLQSLETTSADPHERLTSIVAESAAFRDNSDSSSGTRIMDLAGLVPTTLLGLTVKAATAMPFSGPTIANTTVSNVPGPKDPIYFAGARLVRVTGLGPLIGGMNLFHVIASYNGTVSMGVTADRDALPDPANYADCMQAAFDELLATTA
jgi:WS/DGAT/MGAT family acyltransferase